MAAQSAGILLFRRARGEVQFLLAHPGGPYWSKKDEGSWSIPKGLYEAPEEAIDAARRELREEIGLTVAGDLVELGKFRQPSGKVIAAWASEGEFDVAALRSNTFLLEWPPRSGTQVEFPEVDRAGWFTLTEAAAKITKGQLPILAALAAELGLDFPAPSKPPSPRANRRPSRF